MTQGLRSIVAVCWFLIATAVMVVAAGVIARGIVWLFVFGWRLW